MSVVLDASVLVKLVITEPGSDEARTLVRGALKVSSPCTLARWRNQFSGEIFCGRWVFYKVGV